MRAHREYAGARTSLAATVVPWLLLLVVGLAALALAAASMPVALAGLTMASLRRHPRRRWARALGAALAGFLGGAMLVRAALAWGRSPPALAALDIAALRIPRDHAPRTSPDP